MLLFISLWYWQFIGSLWHCFISYRPICVPLSLIYSFIKMLKYPRSWTGIKHRLNKYIFNIRHLHNKWYIFIGASTGKHIWLYLYKMMKNINNTKICISIYFLYMEWKSITEKITGRIIPKPKQHISIGQLDIRFSIPFQLNSIKYKNNWISDFLQWK